MRPEPGVGVLVGGVSVGGGARGAAVVVHLRPAKSSRVVVDIVVLQRVRRHGLTHSHYSSRSLIALITVSKYLEHPELFTPVRRHGDSDHSALWSRGEIMDNAGHLWVTSPGLKQENSCVVM